MSRTTLTPKSCGLLSMETTWDSSARYFPLSQTIVGGYMFFFTMSQTMADSSGMCFLLSRTIRDEYVFHFSMSNRLPDRYPCRGVLNTPLIDSTSTHSTFVGRIEGVCNTPLHCRKKIRFPWVGIFHCLGQSETNMYFILSCPIGYQIGTHVGRKSIRPLRVYRLPPRPLQGVW